MPSARMTKQRSAYMRARKTQEFQALRSLYGIALKFGTKEQIHTARANMAAFLSEYVRANS